MRHHHRIVVVVLSLLSIACQAHADGLIVVDRPVDVPHGHHRFAPLEVKHHDVTVTIRDQVAISEVDQAFYNPNNQRLEGHYIFPIPINAHLDQFTMVINGVETQAELLDAGKARGIYEDIVRRMKDPALLEYAGRDMFKVRIFPIEPHEVKHISLRYTQLLEQDSGLVEYVYPLNTEKFSAAPVENVSVTIDVAMTDGIDTLYCPSHEAEIIRNGASAAKVSWEAQHVRPSTDFHLIYSRTSNPNGPVGLSTMVHRPSRGEDGWFTIMLSPHDINRKDVLPKDVVFVIDTSGSMVGKKLDQAKNALHFCLANLNDEDRFEIIRFSTETEALFNELQSTTDVNLALARDFVDDFKPIGGSAIDEALNKAVKTFGATEKGRPAMVIFLTDGKPTVGIRDQQAILDNVVRNVGSRTMRVFSFGIGTEVNARLLDHIARETRATNDYVLPDEDIELKISNLYSKIDAPVLANPTLKIEGDVRVNAMHPNVLPDIFIGNQVIICGRYQGSGDVLITLEGQSGEKTERVVYESTFPEIAADHDYLPRLWAMRRIGFLLEQERLNGESSELRDEVVMLARRFNVVTPYTAYLIVEDEMSRGVPGRDRTVRLNREAGGSPFGDGGGLSPSASSGAVDFEAARAAGRLRESKSAMGGSMLHDQSEARVLHAMAAGEAVTDRDQIMRYVAGRAFFRTTDGWIDATIQALIDQEVDLKERRVEFGSADYFKLLEEHPDMGKWLALGEHMRIRMGNDVIVISPTN